MSNPQTPPIENDPAGDPQDAWSRSAVTFRLTPGRKAALAKLNTPGDPPLSPTSALDAAIDRAAGGREGMGRALPAERDAAQRDGGVLVELLRALRTDAANARSRLAQLAEDLAELRATISSACVESEDPDGSQGAASPTLRLWLDARAAEPAAAWLVARARWVAKRPAGPGMSVWEMDLAILGAQGRAAPRAEPPTRAVFGPAPSDAAPWLELGQPLALMCSKTDRGWRLVARAIDHAGKLGDALATIEVH